MYLLCSVPCLIIAVTLFTFLNERKFFIVQTAGAISSSLPMYKGLCTSLSCLCVFLFSFFCFNSLLTATCLWFQPLFLIKLLSSLLLGVAVPLRGNLLYVFCICLHRKERIETEPADFSSTRCFCSAVCVHGRKYVCVVSRAQKTGQWCLVKGMLKGSVCGGPVALKRLHVGHRAPTHSSRVKLVYILTNRWCMRCSSKVF